MAEAIFKKLSKDVAISAGVEPADNVDENMIAVLKELGIDTSNLRPKKLTDSMLEKADKIITFKCYDAIPEKLRNKTENWDIGAESVNQLQDVYSLEYLRKVRDQIGEKVERLIRNLGAT